MKKLAVLLFLIAAPDFAQSNQDVVKDIPKPGECLAAINTWNAQIQPVELDHIRETLKNVSVNTLLNRQKYLVACKEAYPQFEKSGGPDMMSALDTIITVYNTESSLRMREFLAKRHLLEQFYAEDAKEHDDGHRPMN